MDVTDIEAGVDFVDVLQRAVGSCDVLLAVIGREWLASRDRSGRRRLDDPHDFIRLEVGAALARNVRVIPVLVEGAVMPAAAELPSDLEGLTRRQAIELRDGRWNADVAHLAGALDRVPGPRSAEPESTRSRARRAGRWGLVAVVLVAVLVGVISVVPRGGSTPSEPAPQTAPTSGPADQRAAVPAEPLVSASSAEFGTNPAPITEQPPPRAVSPARETTPASAPVRGARSDAALSDAGPPATPVSVGWLGVQLVNGTADSSGGVTRGAKVQSVAAGGPAAAAGLLAGDLVVEYAGRLVTDAAGLIGLAGAGASGDSVLIRVRRGSTGRTLEVVTGDRPAAMGASGTVSVHYAEDAEQKTAEDLASDLRASINDSRYAVRTFKSSRGASGEGEVLYSSPGLSTLSGTVARSASSWLSRTYGRRVVLTPRVEARVAAKGVIVNMPGRKAPQGSPRADAVVTIAYPTGDDPRIAEELATFLRAQSKTTYLVRTVRATTGPGKEGQVEYDNPRMSGPAQVLARDAGRWIAQAYGRQVALKPTLSGRIGANALLLWLPGR